MADRLVDVLTPGTQKRFRDMGDGTHAEVFAAMTVGLDGAIVDPAEPTQVEFEDMVAFGVQSGAAADAILFFQDVTGFGSLVVEVQQVTNTSLRVECSIDGVNRWEDAPGYAINQVGNPAATAVLVSTIKYRIPVAARYMRVRQITAGSTQVAVFGSMIQSPPAAIQGGCYFYTESVATLPATNVFTGQARNNQGSPGSIGTRYRTFLAEIWTDQAGTLYIEKSTDAATWRVGPSIAAAPGGNAQLSVQITAQYYRVRYVNGASPQTIMLLTSAFVS